MHLVMPRRLSAYNKKRVARFSQPFFIRRSGKQFEIDRVYFKIYKDKERRNGLNGIGTPVSVGRVASENLFLRSPFLLVSFLNNYVVEYN
jgi:hypothetical protein